MIENTNLSSAESRRICRIAAQAYDVISPHQNKSLVQNHRNSQKENTLKLR